MGEFKLEEFRKMGHWRRIRSRQALKQGSSAVSWLVDAQMQSEMQEN